MEQPIVLERFADNGEHSHWALVSSEDHRVLWSEAPFEDAITDIKVEVAKNKVIEDFIIDGGFDLMDNGSHYLFLVNGVVHKIEKSDELR